MKLFKNKNKVAPDSPPQPVRINNFFSDDTDTSSISAVTNGTFYFFRVGNAEFFMNKLQPQQSNNTIHGLIEKNTSFDAKKNDFGPLDVTDFHTNELAAFAAAKEKFSSHAVSIFKIVIPEYQSHPTQQFTTSMLATVKADLANFVQSIKSISTRDFNSSIHNQKLLDHAVEFKMTNGQPAAAYHSRQSPRK